MNKHAIYEQGDVYYKLVSCWHTLEEAWQLVKFHNTGLVVKQIGEDWPPDKVLYREIESRIKTRNESKVQHDERIDHIVDKLIMLRKQTDTLSMAKAELLTEVKEDKLYKDRYSDFGTFCKAIGYHRTTVCNLIAAYSLPVIREAYPRIGAMASKAILAAKNAGLDDDTIRGMVDFAKDHTSAASVRKVRTAIVEHASIEDTDEEDLSPREELIARKENLLAQKASLVEQLSQIDQELTEITEVLESAT